MNIAAFDIETINWSEKFLVGGFFDGKSYQRSWDEDGFFDILMKADRTKTVIYAHNGGKFDFLWLLSVAKSRGYEPKVHLIGSAILTLTIDNLVFRDSYPLLMSSLDKCGEMIGERKQTLDIDFSEFSNPKHKQKIEEYLEQDCRLLYKIMNFISSYAKMNGIILKNTIASTAWSTAQTFLDLKDSEISFSEYYRLREGYYGGRVECYKPKFVDTAVRIDRNASYPTALAKTEIPVGNPILSTNCHYGKHPGIFTCVVYVPDCHIPVLPVRVKGRLFFPTGVFTGTWTDLELEYAETQGVVIRKEKRCLFFRERRLVFKPFIEHIWKLRQEAETKALKKFLKWLANSLTGKFAQNPNQRIITHKKEAGLETLSPYGDYMSKEVHRIPQSSYPHWSAYLTSEARISLHKKLIESTDPIYCDTDSVFAKEAIPENQNVLGGWKLEGKMSEWLCLAPKAYSYYDLENQCFINKFKGLAKITREDFLRLKEGETIYQDKKPKLFLSSSKTGKYWGKDSLRTVKKTHRPKKGWLGGRFYYGGEHTYSPVYSHLTER